MRLEELHRFQTPLIERKRHLYWDIESMWAEIQFALAKSFDTGVAIRSVSVDSWAVDYVPLDLHGNALRRPYSYRDPRTAGRMDAAIELAGGADALYDRTGIQFLELNTLPQVVADIRDEPEHRAGDGDAPAHRRVLPVSAVGRTGGRGDDGEHHAARGRAHAARGRGSDQGDRRRRVAVAAHRPAGHGARPAASRARAGRRRSRADGARVLRARHRVGGRRGARDRRAPLGVHQLGTWSLVGHGARRAGARLPRRASTASRTKRDSTARCASSRTARGCGCSRSAAASGRSRERDTRTTALFRSAAESASSAR